MDIITLINILKCSYYVKRLFNTKNIWNLNSCNPDHFELIKRSPERKPSITNILFQFTYDLYCRKHNINVIYSNTINHFDYDNKKVADNIDKCLYVSEIAYIYIYIV